MEDLNQLETGLELVAVADQNDFERDLMSKADKEQLDAEDALDERRLKRSLEKLEVVEKQIATLSAAAIRATSVSEKRSLHKKCDRLKDQRDDLKEELKQIRDRKDQRHEEHLVQGSQFRTADDAILIPESLRGLNPVAVPRGDSTEEELSSGDEDGLEDDGQEVNYERRLLKWAKRNQIRRGLDPKDLTVAGAKREILVPAFVNKDADLGDGYKCPYRIYKRLFPYQRVSLVWLWQLYKERVGGILGDEMGLGKTIQIVSFLAGLHYSRKLRGPILVVCPATVLRQWVKEFNRWWPPFRVVVMHATGSGMSLEADLKNEIIDGEPAWTSRADGLMRQLINKVCEKGHVIVTTYGAIRCHREKLLPVNWGFCVLDEGHKIRNPDAEVTVCCKMVRTAHRIILSGTPIQNNLRELWSLFDFVYPGRLGTLPIFQTEFATPIQLGGYANATNVQVQAAYRCAVVLRDLINPYLLRRLKIDVAKDLPAKREQVLFVKLTPFQKALYREFLASRDCQAILNGKRHVLYGIDLLRKICNHPDLLLHHRDPSNRTMDRRVLHKLRREKRGTRSRLDTLGFERAGLDAESSSSFAEKSESDISDDGKDGPLEDGTEEGHRGSFHTQMFGKLTLASEDFGNPERSGKMKTVKALLDLWWNAQRDQGHKVLLFCQTRQVKQVLSKMLRSMELPFIEMDGTTPVKDRMLLVHRFNSAPSEQVFIFLLTTKVGGLGINLTAANRVVIFDPDWNPSTDVQARERAWRLGQKREVTIYRLLTAGSIEEKILHRQIFKTYLASRILKDPKQKRFFKSSELYELFSLTEHQEGSETADLFSGLGAAVPLNPQSSSHKNLEQAPQEKGSEDERVLEWIGVQSALHHDVLMDAKGESFEKIIVDKEASKIAREAMNALKQSRREIMRANNLKNLGDLGSVTWTGRVGGAPVLLPGGELSNGPDVGKTAPDTTQTKKRFGTRLNSEAVRAAHETLGVVNMSRGSQSAEGVAIKAEDALPADEKSLPFLMITFFRSVGNRARTSQVLEALSEKVDVSDPSKVLAFRKILTSVAKFKRGPSESVAGYWQLKEEYNQEAV